MTITVNNEVPRDAGLALRKSVIDYFTSDDFAAILKSVLQDEALAHHGILPFGEATSSIVRDMDRDPSWVEEFWSIEADGTVERLEQSVFEDLPANKRFSRSDCLRHPLKDSYALRGLLSGLHSEEVSERFSEVAGTGKVQFMTSDIARYRPGHYLRRHDDVYDGRVFGLVFFLHDNWQQGFGTELIAEKPDGRAAVVRPEPSSYALMRLAGSHYHQVAENLSNDWTRYSIAVHFGIRD